MTEAARKCSHCKGTGTCHTCKGSGRMALQKGRPCTNCFPHGSGKCANCRGSGLLDPHGRPMPAPEAEAPDAQ